MSSQLNKKSTQPSSETCIFFYRKDKNSDSDPSICDAFDVRFCASFLDNAHTTHVPLVIN